MELEQFIRQKAWGIHQKKLESVRSNFEQMLPESRAHQNAIERPIYRKDFRDHAEAHGSNILTDMFGADFGNEGFSDSKSVVKAFIDILILAYGIDTKTSLFDPEYHQNRDLDKIKKKIMEQMQSAIPDDEPETSITIKGKGIKVDEHVR